MKIEEKKKLYECVDEGEEDEGELKFVKPKKFVKKQNVITTSQKKIISTSVL